MEGLIQDEKIITGKVRDVYELNEGSLVIVTTDRISAFDVVLPSVIPQKGIAINLISNFWFDFVKNLVPNHIISLSLNDMPTEFNKNASYYDNRTILVKKLKMLPYEFIVRGYMFGSMWKSYQDDRTFCGKSISGEYALADKLKVPIITPSAKNNNGHDEYISMERLSHEIGEKIAEEICSICMNLYEQCYEYAFEHGIIIADTKFEFGFDEDGVITLADEIFTPDSSRFWDIAEYCPGKSPKSYDKQFVRDWLIENKMDGVTPAVELPKDLIDATSRLYQECLLKIVPNAVIYKEQNLYWDNVAETKKFTSEMNFPLFSNLISKESRILDVGCGYGRTLVQLHDNGFNNLYGIDFSEKMIKRAREENPDFETKVSTAEDTGYASESFDAVILFSVLTCLIENDAQQKVIDELLRVLKPNGVIFVNDFLLNTDARNLERYEMYRDKYNEYGIFELQEGAVLRHHSAEHIKKLFHPFIEIEYNQFVKTTMNGNQSNGFSFIGRKNALA